MTNKAQDIKLKAGLILASFIIAVSGTFITGYQIAMYKASKIFILDSDKFYQQGISDSPFPNAKTVLTKNIHIGDVGVPIIKIEEGAEDVVIIGETFCSAEPEVLEISRDFIPQFIIMLNTALMVEKSGASPGCFENTTKILADNIKLYQMLYNDLYEKNTLGGTR